MAKIENRVPDNVPGEFFVDEACINCGACRNLAPRVFSDNGDTSFVARQPENALERTRSFQALLTCPVNAIGASRAKVPLEIHHSFPLPLEDGVHVNGFNSPSSFGADSYFIQSGIGNWMIDSPRFMPSLIENFGRLGGLKYIFLTHRDDVADAARYAQRFGAQRIIHERDQSACPQAEIVLEGDGPTELDGALLIPTPGHTRGHSVLLWRDKYLFTGDHLSWSTDDNAFRPFRDACWFSWEEQIKSVQKLAPLANVERVLPGHGTPWRREGKRFPELIEEAVAWMRRS